MPSPRLLIPAAVAVLTGCASDPQIDPHYRPAENVLEVIAVLRRHVPDDTYRFEPARDFTGRNVYRSALLRLESIERVHSRALRAGHMDGALAFAKGRSLERLRAFDLASQHYRLAASREKALRVEALRSADLCSSLHAAAQVGAGLELAAREEETVPLDANPEHALAEFERREDLLQQQLEAAGDTHHVAVVREEIERTDTVRARYFAGMRRLLPDGDVRAVAEMQRVVLRNQESKNANRHMLALGNLYAELAQEYAAAHPPESLDFDPVRFQELVDAAARLYEMVANVDGTPEKLEASRRLEAFLAFALRIDHDRFTP